MQKYILKQQFKGFSVSNSEGLYKGYDSFPQLDHEDLEQLDEYNLEEMDLKWQVAMISMRMKKFYKKSSRKLQFDSKEPVGFDKTKVECYNCHKTGHFARECRIKGNQDNRRRDVWNSRNKDGSRTGKKEDSKALVTIDGEGVDWTSHSEEDKDYALMSCNSSESDTEVTSCSNECKESYGKIKKLYDAQREQLSDVSIEIKAYTQGLKKVEAQIVTHQQGQLWLGYGILNMMLREYESDCECVLSIPTKNRKHIVLPIQQVKFLGKTVKIISHIAIRDCDFHEKRMAKQAELNNGLNKNSSQREIRQTLEQFSAVGGKRETAVKPSVDDAGAAAHKHSDLKTDEKPVDKEDQARAAKASSTNIVNTVSTPAKASSTNIVNNVSTPVSIASPYDGLSLFDLTNPEQDDSEIPALEDIYKNPTDVKVVKALYGLHQAPRAWYATLSTFLLQNGYRRGTIDKTLFIKKDKHDIILVQVYVDDIIFGSTKKSWCDEFEALMKKILKKFDFVNIKTASTPIETQKPLIKDEEASDVDIHLYRYLKGKPKLGLWYPRVSSFYLEAYSDSVYARVNLDRKSTIRGCQFLGRRLISWQCKKLTIVATSTTEAEYVAAASCCGQVVWIQNQMLDYGFNFMNTKIYIDNESTICIVKNPVYHSKTKHIAIRHHFIRDAYEKKLIQVLKIHTDDNVDDLLTKAFDVSSGNMFSTDSAELVNDGKGRYRYRDVKEKYHQGSILESSGGNHGGHSSSDKSLLGNEGEMTFQSVYDLCISLCTQVLDQAKEIQLLKAQIKKLKKQAKPVITHHRAWLKSVLIEARLIGKSSLKKNGCKSEYSINDESSLKLKLRIWRLRICSDVGRTRDRTEKKFKQLASDEEMARKVQEEWEGEEERKILAKEEATNDALIRNYDDKKARIKADRLLAEQASRGRKEREAIYNSEIMEKKSVIARLNEVSSPDGDYLVIYRANGNFRAFNYLMEGNLGDGIVIHMLVGKKISFSKDLLPKDVDLWFGCEKRKFCCS
ncbi:putative ribonuclease H-like domain-containing protein [Tanacetum coccineum]